MKNKILGLVAALLFPVTLLAQPSQSADARTTTEVLRNYDLDSTTYVYPVLQPPILSTCQATTSGASTTVTAGSGCAAPFLPIGVGAQLIFSLDNGTAVRTVTAKASDISITVDSAIDLDDNGVGYPFHYRTFSAGTADTSGWFTARFPGISFGVLIALNQVNVTGGIDFRIECRVGQDASPVAHNYRNVTIAGMGAATGAADTGRYFVEILPHFDACRVAMKIGTADDGGDLTTNAEQISLWTVTY